MDGRGGGKQTGGKKDGRRRGPQASVAGMEQTRERFSAVLCHLLAIPGLLVPPLAGMVLAPLVVWLLKRRESVFVDVHGRKAINFQLSVLLYLAIIAPFAAAMPIFTAVAVALVLFDVACVLMACNKANDGKGYRYPFSIPFVEQTDRGSPRVGESVL